MDSTDTLIPPGFTSQHFAHPWIARVSMDSLDTLTEGPLVLFYQPILLCTSLDSRSIHKYFDRGYPLIPTTANTLYILGCIGIILQSLSNNACTKYILSIIIICGIHEKTLERTRQHWTTLEVGLVLHNQYCLIVVREN